MAPPASCGTLGQVETFRPTPGVLQHSDPTQGEGSEASAGCVSDAALTRLSSLALMVAYEVGTVITEVLEPRPESSPRERKAVSLSWQNGEHSVSVS